MIAFVVLCLTSAPDTCERHEIMVEATELQCLTTAQQIIAPYVRAGFTVARFGCERSKG